MKRLILFALTTVAIVFVTSAQTYGAETERSKSIVYINGSRYYVHAVSKGDTMHSLSKLYNLDEAMILEANPYIKEGLKSGINIKIPTIGEQPQKSIPVRKQRKIFDSHTVIAGETPFSISRKYKISVQTILEDNPQLDPLSLSIGQKLSIRKNEKGLANEKQIQGELDLYREQMNKVAPDGYIYHVVEKGDTLYSLAKECGVTTNELMEINVMRDDDALNLGEIILLKRNPSTNDTDNIVDGVSILSKVDFIPLKEHETLRVSLLLPLTISGDVVKPFEEFYKGFLLGVEDLRKRGRSVEVNLYNSERNIEKVRSIIKEEEYQSSDLVVGPVYEELLEPVLRDAEDRMIPVVSPLATINSVDSPVLFQMAPNSDNRNDKIDDLLSQNSVVTLIYSSKNDTRYDAEVKKMLDDRGVRYKKHIYTYEHPSIAQERQIAAKKRVERMQESAHARGEVMSQVLIDSLLRISSKSDLTPLIANSAEHNTLFVMSDNEVDVDRILSALASAYTSQVTKNIGSVRDISKALNFNVVANPNWRRYKNIDRAIYFRDRVVTYSSYHAGRDSEVIKDFDNRYGKEFNEFPSLYSYRGYDIANIFGDGLYDDIQYGMEGKIFKPLQTQYRFENVEGKLYRVNTNWVEVNYNPDFTLTIE